MNQNDAQGTGNTAPQDTAEADTLDDRSAQDRKAKLAMMLAREQDPEHQRMVQAAEAVFERLEEAEAFNMDCEGADARGIPSELRILREDKRAAKAELEAAKKAHREAKGDPHTPSTTTHHAAPTVVESVPPLQRSAAQDAAILAAIQNAGLDPQALPVNPPGKKGAKATIRAALEGVSPLFQAHGKTFNKAWERLRERGEIANRP